MKRVGNSDAEIIRMAELALGMTMIGATHRKSHGFIFLDGPGGAGKGTFCRTVGDVLYDYAHVLSGRELTSQADSHSTSLADLEGVRFAVVLEQPTIKLDSDKVNAITGGDQITARKMQRDNRTFDPSHTLWMSGNSMPMLNVNEATRRRLRPIPTAAAIPEKDKDQEWEGKLMEEADGIFAHMVQWCMEYQKADWKLPTPTTMTEHRDSAMEEQDMIGQWFGEKLDVGGNDDFVVYSDLVRSYNTWRQSERNLRDMTESELTKFTGWLKNEGYKSDRRSVSGEQTRGRVGMRWKAGVLHIDRAVARDGKIVVPD